MKGWSPSENVFAAILEAAATPCPQRVVVETPRPAGGLAAAILDEYADAQADITDAREHAQTERYLAEKYDFPPRIVAAYLRAWRQDHDRLLPWEVSE